MAQVRAFDLEKQRGKHTFGSGERLKQQALIDQLFSEGKSVHTNGFTLVYLAKQFSAPFPAQAGFSVPKRNFKHAVDRNRVKRLLREAYRHRKFALYEKLLTAQQQLLLMWVYKGREVPDLKTVETAVEKLLLRLEKVLIAQ